jgi:hypothetical protein
MINDLVKTKSLSSIIGPSGNRNRSSLRERRFIDCASSAARFRSGCLAIHPKLNFCTMCVNVRLIHKPYCFPNRLCTTNIQNF